MSDTVSELIDTPRLDTLQGTRVQLETTPDRPKNAGEFLKRFGMGWQVSLREPSPNLEWLTLKNSETGLDPQEILFVNNIQLSQEEWRLMFGYEKDTNLDFLKDVKLHLGFTYANDLIKGRGVGNDHFDIQMNCYHALTNGIGTAFVATRLREEILSATSTNENGVRLREDLAEEIKGKGIKDIVLLNGHGVGVGEKRFGRDRIIGDKGDTAVTIYEALRATAQVFDNLDKVAVINLSCPGASLGDETVSHPQLGTLATGELTVPVPLVEKYSQFIYCEPNFDVGGRKSGPASMVIGDKQKGLSIISYKEGEIIKAKI